jgi:hypothetical protein
LGNLLSPDIVAENDVVFTIGNPTAPAAPQSLLTGAATGGGVALSWQPVSGAAYYKIKRASALGGPYTTIGGGACTASTTYTDNTVVQVRSTSTP